MPKKTRKAKMRASNRPVNVGYAPPRPTQAGAEPMPRRAAPSSLGSRSAGPLTFDYGYVYKDLRRIGLLAGFFFLAMIVVWFLLQYTTVLRPLGLS